MSSRFIVNLAQSAISMVIKNDTIALWAACVLLRRMSLSDIETTVFMIWSGLDARMASFIALFSEVAAQPQESDFVK